MKAIVVYVRIESMFDPMSVCVYQCVFEYVTHKDPLEKQTNMH